MQGNDAIKNATSLLDYVFRELAVSYLGRADLAHVSPAEIGGTVIGGGESGDTTREGPKPAPASSVVSRGLLRGSADRLTLIQGGPAGAGSGSVLPAPAVGSGRRHGPRDPRQHGAEGRAGGCRSGRDDRRHPPLRKAERTVADRRAEAKMKGYVGEACPECANFTLVRNGTCLKCDTCGSTTGCS